jgi:hypothetical protein
MTPQKPFSQNDETFNTFDGCSNDRCQPNTNSECSQLYIHALTTTQPMLVETRLVLHVQTSQWSKMASDP